MRGALAGCPGVDKDSIDLNVDKKLVSVEFDESQTDVEKLIAAVNAVDGGGRFTASVADPNNAGKEG